MSTNATWNGITYAVPAVSEENWGGSTGVDGLLIALVTHGFQKTGGLFTLSADADFGATAGLKSLYYQSRNASPADAGQVRLGNAETIAWRNNADSDNNTLAVNSSDQLVYNGTVLASSGGVVPVPAGGTGLSSYTTGDILYASASTTLAKLAVGAAGTVLKGGGATPAYGAVVNADIDASAAIARSKVATGTNYRIVANDGSGNLSENAALTAAHVVYADANGQLAGEANLAISRGGTGAGTAGAAFDALSPLTTKADLLTYHTSANQRFGVGADGKILAANSGETAGLEWIDPPQGGRNYVPSGGSRDGNASVGDWVAFDDGTLADGTGGSPNVSIASNTSTPLVGAGHLRLSTTAADNSGEGWSVDLDTIEEADKGKVHTIEFFYRTGSNYVDDDIEVWIYDVTNASLIQPTPYLIKAESLSAGAELFQAQVQLPIDSDSFRLILHQAGTNSNAVDVDIDEVKFSPVVRAYGTPVTDWISFTPTFNNITGTATGKWRRVGDSMEIEASLDVTGSASTTITMSMPSGYSIDTSKISTGTTTGAWETAILGFANGSTNGGSSTASASVRYNSATSLRFWESTNDGGDNWAAAQPFTWASGDGLALRVTVPIVGWSSSTVMSDSADTRVIAASASRNTTQSIANTTIVEVIFDDLIKDDTGAYSTSTGRFTVPVPGWYEISASVDWDSSSTGSRRLYALKNGSEDHIIASTVTPVASTGLQTSGKSREIYCNAGDYLSVGVRQASGGSLNIGALTDPSYFWVSFKRLSGPSQIAASEIISATYTMNGSTGNAALATGSAEIVDFNVKQHDTHDAVTTGGSWKFTAPAAGEYRLHGYLAIDAVASGAIGNVLSARLSKNGSFVRTIGSSRYQTTSSVANATNFSITVRLIAGDYIAVEGFQNSGSGVNIDQSSFVSIERIGGI